MHASVFMIQISTQILQALSLLSALDKQFNSNLYILQNVARCYVRLGDAEKVHIHLMPQRFALTDYFCKAQHIFQKIRVIDSNAIDYMDAYASILKAQVRYH